MMKAILIAAATILQAYLLGSLDTGILVNQDSYIAAAVCAIMAAVRPA